MATIITVFLSTLGRKAALLAAITFALMGAFWVAFRSGRHEAEAEFMNRRADARIQSLQTAKEITHEVCNTDRTELERRAQRWMRN